MAIKVRNTLYAGGDEVRYNRYRDKICTRILFSKRRYNDTFFGNYMGNMKKNLVRYLWTLISTKKKLKSNIFTKGF